MLIESQKKLNESHKSDSGKDTSGPLVFIWTSLYGEIFALTWYQ